MPVPRRPRTMRRAQLNPLQGGGVDVGNERMLTNLYNARPQWVVDAHETLDAAVAAAYGWSADISDDDGLRELLALNGGGP